MMMSAAAAATVEIRELPLRNKPGGGQNNPSAFTLQATSTTADNGQSSRNRTTSIGRDDVIRKYEAMLLEATLWARSVGFLYASSRFIACCNLTWATVVLLGGFCSDLHSLDFWSVAGLLLAEAARLASATFFAALLNRSLRNLSQNLPDLATSPDPRPERANIFTRSFSLIDQYCINILVMIITATRVLHICSYSQADYSHNLRPALLVFYCLLQANSGLNMVTIGTDYIAARRLGAKDGDELSFIRYYDHILQKFLSGSIGVADRIDFFHFAYVALLGPEFQRNVQANIVVKQYGKMVEYLYAHRQGLDHLFINLKYGDASVQQAAANVPGLWMSRPITRAMVKTLREGLVMRLVRRLPENGQVGWAAANSLGAIAASGRGDLLLSFGTKVGDALAAAIDSKTSRSLVLVRAMVFLVHGQVQGLTSTPSRHQPDGVLSKIFSSHRREKLERDLETMIRNAKVHRVRALSAYLYFLLGLDPTQLIIIPTVTDSTSTFLLLGIRPVSDRYWLSREKEMLGQLYDRFTRMGRIGNMPGFPDNVIREDGELTVPLWALRWTGTHGNGTTVHH